MFWLGLITLIGGMIGYHSSGKQSKPSEWAIGAGLLLLAVAAFQTDRSDEQRCKRGNDAACAALDQRQQDGENVRP